MTAREVMAPRPPVARMDVARSVPRWPEDQVSHPAIVSGWSDSFLLVRTSSGAVRRIDLASVPLPSNADVGGPLRANVKLGDFPHWMDVCKAYAALALHDTTAHNAADIVFNAMNHVFRFLAWCIRRRVLRLDALTSDDLKEFAKELHPRGWFSALSFDSRLKDAVDLAAVDSDLRDRLVRKPGGGSSASFSPGPLSEAIGCVITPREYPSWLGGALKVLAPGRRSKFLSGRDDGEREWGASSFKNCFVAVRRLNRIAPPLDRLSFDPFPNARVAARASGGRPDSRTPNLPLEEAGKLLACALSWIYDKSPAIEQLLKTWAHARSEASGNGGGAKAAQAAALRAVNAEYTRLRAEFNLPPGSIGIGRVSKDGLSLIEFVHRVQTAAVVLIGINQARRKNEIIGEGARPWGVYFGCVEKSDPFVDAYEIDIYIEKTWQDWRRMPSNRITADVVAALERLRLAMTGLALPRELELTERRACKLFVVPREDSGGTVRLGSYSFERHCDGFFDEAKIAKKWRRTHQFRRLFALLYMYRHDHPSLQALSEALCHLDLECTRTYVTDSSMVDEAERIGNLYRNREDEAPLEELGEVRREYADAQIRAMLTSSEVGGTLTRRVRKWVRRLAAKAEFDTDDLNDAVSSIRSGMSKPGHEPTPYAHGVCWASDRHAARASCGRKGGLARENAGVATCSSCPFHSTSVAFLENVERDIGELRSRMRTAICSSEEAALRIEIEALRNLVALERSLMARGSLSIVSPVGGREST